MKKIGILGGTFNPIHNGHLNIATCAYTYLHLDEVWFLPAGTPPHKDVASHVSVLHRKIWLQPLLQMSRILSFVPWNWRKKRHVIPGRRFRT